MNAQGQDRERCVRSRVHRSRSRGPRGERDARRRLRASDARLLFGGRRLRRRQADRVFARSSGYRRRSWAWRASSRIGVASLMAGRRARIAQVALASVAAAGRSPAPRGAGDPWPILPLLLRGGRERRRAPLVAAWWRFARSADATVPRAFGLVAGGRAGGGRPRTSRRRLAPRGSRAGVIRAEMARTRELGPVGAVTVVDFVDFECPFCRMTHAELEPILEAHRDRLRVVRRQVPLHMHPHALDAARAACCGERLGSGDAMASALFSAPVDQLTRGGLREDRSGGRARARPVSRMRRRPEDRRADRVRSARSSRPRGGTRSRPSGSTVVSSSGRSRAQSSSRRSMRR